MSTQRFPLEFKEETVKQVTERGDSVAEVSARQGFPATACTNGCKRSAQITRRNRPPS
jgi:transposase-like protein